MRLKKEEKKKGKGGKIGDDLQNPRLLGDAVHVFISMSRERNVRKVGRVDVGEVRFARDKTRIGGHSWYDVDGVSAPRLVLYGKRTVFSPFALIIGRTPARTTRVAQLSVLGEKMKTMGLEKIYAHPPVKCNLPRCEIKPTKPPKRDHPPTMNKRNM